MKLIKFSLNKWINCDTSIQKIIIWKQKEMSYWALIEIEKF